MHRSRTINIEQMKNNRWTNEQQCIDEHEYRQLFFFFTDHYTTDQIYILLMKNKL